MGGGARRNERMSGGTARKQKRRRGWGGGVRWPRVEVRHGGWREHRRNNEQAGLL